MAYIVDPSGDGNGSSSPRNKANVSDIDELICRSGSVEPISQHQVEIITAYTYLSGQYLSFHDMLNYEKQELLFEDGLKLLTARYGFRDRERVREKLKALKTSSYEFGGEYEVYYEYEETPPGALRAEYVLEQLGYRFRFRDGIWPVRDSLMKDSVKYWSTKVMEI